MAKHHEEGLSLAASTADDHLRLIVSGKGRLLENLYRSHLGNLTRYIASRFGSGPPDPDDVAQAAFAKLAMAPDMDALANPRGYLYTIARNIVIDHHRRARYRETIHRDLSERADIDKLSDFSPEDVLLARERFTVLEAALKAMPKMRRRIFLLVRAEGMLPKEVARQFGMTEGAVYKHVSRALKDCLATFEKCDKRWDGR